MAACYNCGATFPVDMVVTRTEECPHCSRPVRCCRNCEFYLPGAHRDCRESGPELVADKERSNFCDWFRLNRRSGTAGSAAPTGEKGSGSRRAFDDLFS